MYTYKYILITLGGVIEIIFILSCSVRLCCQRGGYICNCSRFSVIFTHINLKILILFVHIPDVLCYVVLSYHVLVTSPHPRFFCLFIYFSALMCFPPVLACNLFLTLCCVCPLCNYLYLHCAVSVFGLVAIDSAEK
jgi:hypothetical protein